MNTCLTCLNSCLLITKDISSSFNSYVLDSRFVFLGFTYNVVYLDKLSIQALQLFLSQYVRCKISIICKLNLLMIRRYQMCMKFIAMKYDRVILNYAGVCDSMKFSLKKKWSFNACIFIETRDKGGGSLVRRAGNISIFLLQFLGMSVSSSKGCFFFSPNKKESEAAGLAGHK